MKKQAKADVSPIQRKILEVLRDHSTVDGRVRSTAAEIEARIRLDLIESMQRAAGSGSWEVEYLRQEWGFADEGSDACDTLRGAAASGATIGPEQALS